MKYALIVVLMIHLAVLSPNSHAWGSAAHRLIGELAESRLTPKAAAEVRRLLAAEPSATLGSVAPWADEHRSRVDAPWHYVNIPPAAGCQYQSKRDCPDGACVVEAIERQLNVLASKASDDQRLRALKYVIHLIGDVHQPLHAGRAEDKGGNTVQLQAFGRGTNLHALWDTGLVVNWPGGLLALQKGAEDQIKSADSSGTPQSWAEESCRLVEQNWFYPRRHTLEFDYQTKANPVIQQRISQAAARLAAELNRALDQ
jgi:hypothetical protein